MLSLSPYILIISLSHKSCSVGSLNMQKIGIMKVIWCFRTFLLSSSPRLLDLIRKRMSARGIFGVMSTELSSPSSSRVKTWRLQHSFAFLSRLFYMGLWSKEYRGPSVLTGFLLVAFYQSLLAPASTVKSPRASSVMQSFICKLVSATWR